MEKLRNADTKYLADLMDNTRLDTLIGAINDIPDCSLWNATSH